MAITRSRGKNGTIKSNEDNLDINEKRKFINQDSQQYIIKSKQSIIKKILQLVISLLLWFHMCIVLYLFVSAAADYNDSYIGILKSYFKVTNEDVRIFMMAILIYFFGCFCILSIWKFYNKKRFGSLNRRKEPKLTSAEDILNLGLVKPEVYKVLQEEKTIIFDKNPIKDLSRRKQLE